MRFLPPFIFAAALLTLSGPAVAAGVIDKVVIRGLDEDDATQRRMIENIRVALSLNDTLGQRLGESRLEYLLQEAATEAAGALEPFGYYSPQVRVEAPRTRSAEQVEAEAQAERSSEEASPRPTPPAVAAAEREADQDDDDDDDDEQARKDSGEPATVIAAVDPTPEPAPTQNQGARPRSPADHLTVTLHVTLGEPVKVRNRDIRIEGEGGRDRYLSEDIAAFQPQQGAVFDHATYEASKLKIVNRLAERGYLDADFQTRKVAVTRAEHAADIDLSWVSGIRYDMGPTHFNQDYFRPGLLDQLVYWDEGSYYHQGKLDRLRQSLSGLDYFSSIDIQPDPENAVDGRVPVEVNLKLAPRNIYSAGVSYGTEFGAGFLVGLERRYVNSRGHKLKTLLDYAQNRKTLTTAYRIPAFKWLDGWYTASIQLYDEQTDYIDTRLIKLTGSRSGQLSERWTATASIHALRERWLYELVDDGQGDAIAAQYRYASYLYPELQAKYVGVDDQLFPRRGFTGTITARGGSGGDSTTFGQLHALGYWFRGIGDDSRLIVRGEIGRTWTNTLSDLPPSLRFYAGGDRSIRGYQFREVGPRINTEGGRYSVGGKNVITGSVEFEHYYKGGPLGGAVFVDSGSAYDNDVDVHTGVGIGVRYRSPIGPVRVDIAHGLDSPDSVVGLYLNIGTSL